MDTLSSTFAILPASTATHRRVCSFQRSIQLATKTADSLVSVLYKPPAHGYPRPRLPMSQPPANLLCEPAVLVAEGPACGCFGFCLIRKVAYGTLSPLGGGGLILQRIVSDDENPAHTDVTDEELEMGFVFNNHLEK